MYEWLIVWAVALAIVALAARGLHSLRKKAGTRGPAPGSGHRASSSDRPAEPFDALSLAQRLDPLYEACAHPTDLLGRPEFERGVSALCDASVPLEQLVNFATGTNDSLAVLAAEALARRPDAAPAVMRLAAFLSHANVWRAFFILRVLEKHAAQPMVGAVLAQARSWWARNPNLPRIVGDFAARRIASGEELNLPAALNAEAAVEPDSIRALLDALSTAHASLLRPSF